MPPILILIKDLLRLRSKFKELVTGRLDEGAKIVAEHYDTPWKSMVFLELIAYKPGPALVTSTVWDLAKVIP